ncbi:hypothetical protein evm_001394 [Chilo suppressalis]|nr:hypothetical protein evm_001394 [Chilo suppressalis]
MDDAVSDYYFTASMDSGKTLCSLLKAIQFQESAVLCALPEGLKLTVEEGKCVQASAYVPLTTSQNTMLETMWTLCSR